MKKETVKKEIVKYEPKFKVGDLVLHNALESAGVGNVMKVIIRSGFCQYKVQWENNGLCNDAESNLTLFDINDKIVVKFNKMNIFLPLKNYKPNELLKELLKRY